MMWAFICSTVLAVCAHEINSLDSIENSISPQRLQEVVVKASPIINRTDGKVLRPNKEMLRTASDGIDLLRKLQIPRISINPLTEEVQVSGGGAVVFCINGVESTSAQVAAIQPQDILRIEYHDTPGIQFADAAVVIDYITSRRVSGGSIFLNSFGALGKGRWASIDNLAAQYNRGRTVWTINAGYFGKHTSGWKRDYDETWNYPDAVVNRKEYGLPVSIGNHSLETSINYNYLLLNGDILNVRFGFNLDDVPNKEEGDRRAILETSDMSATVIVSEHTEEHSVQPDIEAYYKHRLSENQSIIVQGIGSYMDSRMIHEYFEDEVGESSRVDGDKYGGKVLGMYENRVGSRVWSIAVSNTGSSLRNTYNGDGKVNVKIKQSETALMGEYSNRFGNIGVQGNLRAVYRYLGQDGQSLNKFFLRPQATVSYRPSGKWAVRYTASLDYKMPSAAEISDVEQVIQRGMVRRGNPDLKPFRVIDQSLDASFESRIIGVNARIDYRNEHTPIMESVIFDNGEFVRTYFNQRSFQRLMLSGGLTVRPWKDHISISVNPELTRYFSHGKDCKHCHNIFRLGLSADFTYGNWLLYGSIMSGPANYMYGEEIIEEKDMNQIMAGYKSRKWSIHVGVFNAFINYWMESRNLSALTPYTSKAHSGNLSIYAAVKFTLMLDFGRRGREVDVLQNDIDRDSGILNGVK